MAHGTFCTVIGCMDGRCQGPVGEWARREFGVDYPDTLTIAGADGVLLDNDAEWERAVAMAHISTDKHGATQAVVAGHSGCAGFVTDDAGHKEGIKNTVAKFAELGIYETIVGLYHDVETGELTEVCRSSRGEKAAA